MKQEAIQPGIKQLRALFHVQVLQDKGHPIRPRIRKKHTLKLLMELLYAGLEGHQSALYLIDLFIEDHAGAPVTVQLRLQGAAGLSIQLGKLG
ncbi:hypothetical protein D3C76_1716560 [compost metagenome]